MNLSTNAPASVPGRPRLSWGGIFTFSLPAVGAGYMYLMVSIYVMKFATDILLIAPAVMGIIFSASRIWDAVSDPLVGYLSDRTRSRFGRRRVWLAASVVPVSVTSIMIFAPPSGLSGGALSAWMAVAVIGFYSAMSVFFVPHLSLGAELSDNYHDRNRVFGSRHAAHTFGAILALISFHWLIAAEQRGEDIALALAGNLAILASVFMALMVGYAVLRLRERTVFQGRVNPNPVKAFTEVWRNPHARLLYAVTFIEHIGFAVVSVFTLYVIEYVVGAPQWAAFIIFLYMVPSSLSVPLWLPLARRFGKGRLWSLSLALAGLAFGSTVVVLFIDSAAVRITFFAGAIFIAGIAGGCGGTIPPSIQGDVIDYDEYLTGERKEGSYFATWNLMMKSALGVTLLLTGFALELTGFVPNQEQTRATQIAMVCFYGLFPMVFYLGGALLFRRFSFDQAAYDRIRAELDRRAAQLPVGG